MVFWKENQLSHSALINHYHLYPRLSWYDWIAESGDTDRETLKCEIQIILQTENYHSEIKVKKKKKKDFCTMNLTAESYFWIVPPQFLDPHWVVMSHKQESKIQHTGFLFPLLQQFISPPANASHRHWDLYVEIRVKLIHHAFNLSLLDFMKWRKPFQHLQDLEAWGNRLCHHLQSLCYLLCILFFN